MLWQKTGIIGFLFLVGRCRLFYDKKIVIHFVESDSTLIFFPMNFIKIYSIIVSDLNLCDSTTDSFIFSYSNLCIAKR